MDIILLGITIVSLVVALVMSVAAWRVTRDEKKRSAARVAALSLAAGDYDKPEGLSPQQLPMMSPRQSPPADVSLDSFPSQDVFASPVKPVMKAPWSAPATAPRPSRTAAELPLNDRSLEPARFAEPAQLRESDGAAVSHASGFLGAAEVERDNGGRQKTLAFAALFLFVVLSGGLVWTMSGRESSAAAVASAAPLELVSLSHQRQNNKLAVSGLVRNPVAGQPVQELSAVVFLFDGTGTFVTSSRANVDFLKLGAGDESPFVVSLDAPATVSRYRVSFRTEDGVVPHVDRREKVDGQESTVNRQVISRQ